MKTFKKLLREFLFLAACGAIVFTSCKEQEKMEGIEFGSIQFYDPSGLSNSLDLLYQGTPLTSTSTFTGLWNDVALTVLPGEGTFAFVDKATGETVLDTVLTIDPQNPQTYYLIQPDPSIPASLLQNHQEEEMPVRDGYIKVRFANFSKNLLPYNQIKIVFSQWSDELGDYAPVGTLDHVTSLAPETYYELPRRIVDLGEEGTYNDGEYMLTFQNENGEPILDNMGLPVTTEFSAYNSVYTVYISEFSRRGMIFLQLNSIFEN